MVLGGKSLINGFEDVLRSRKRHGPVKVELFGAHAQ